MTRVILQVEERPTGDDMRIFVEENETTTAYERKLGFLYGSRMKAALAQLAALVGDSRTGFRRPAQDGGETVVE